MNPASAPDRHDVQDSGESRAPNRWLAIASRSAGQGDVTLQSSVVFIVLIAVAAWLTDSQPLAVYALGFWHYPLYWLAFRYGRVPLPLFKRDAVLMKCVALLALASAYLVLPIDYASLAVVAAGFLLNALAAATLGSDRTYYGHELAKLPPLKVVRFPYSVISHPMLIGNVLAYGGTLLNAGFRDQWWPLAATHVALNVGLLVMERYIRPLRLGELTSTLSERQDRRHPWAITFGAAAVGAALGMGIAGCTGGSMLLAAAVGAATGAYAGTLYRVYTAPS